MPQFTTDQRQAIDLDNSSIIVSAGAGSGKTAVLSERVIRKLNDGVDINRLLILTFTKEAAKEMKNRIRMKIIKNNLTRQLDLIDSAFITTFDSYSLYIVQKYHYLLKIDKNIKVIDSSIINIKKLEIMNDIFNDYYKENDPLFAKIINDICFKDDKTLIDSIIKINNNLDLKIDKQAFLDNYISNYYSDNNIEKLKNEYLKLILDKIEEIKYNLDYLKTYADGSYYEKLISAINPLFVSLTFEDIKNNIDISLPRLTKADDFTKKYKNNISNLIKEIKRLISLDIDDIYNTVDYAKIIITIIKKLDERIMNFKKEHNSYEFIDIAKMAIQVVRDNDIVRHELKNYYNEIMVDEYQDTSDLQEAFINLISNNNVYMVGDVKQSIYRFRNANPNIFKEKYINYQNNNGGKKIDLLKNFRSRKEVLDSINDIFNLVMNLDIGGADYIKSHQMVFGNTNYAIDPNNKLTILNYEEGSYTKEEAEIFITAQDILEKIKNKYQVMDKETNQMRDITYSDICIIMDRNTEFIKYKQIFEYLNIPLVMYRDEVLSDGTDIILIKNILNLVLKIKNKVFDKEFKYYLTSIFRSYLFCCDDQEIFNLFKDNKLFDNEVFKKCQKISYELDKINNIDLINMVIDDFEFYQRSTILGGMNDTIIRIYYLSDIARNLDELGYSVVEFINYLNDLDKTEIKYSLNTDLGDSVKIMNIHKSKGLEFPVCYYTGLHKKFNISDLKETIFYYDKYGMILPIFKDTLNDTFVKELVRTHYIKEEISEKIRLFYVGLTRAREKMIIVTSLKYQEESFNELEKIKFRSFKDILNSIYQVIEPCIKNVDVNIDSNYKEAINKDLNDYIFDTLDNIVDRNINVKYNILDDAHFSKSNKHLIDKKEQKNLNLGLDIHYILETLDFKNPNFDVVKKEYLPFIKSFLDSDLMKDLNCKIYKEYEFKYTKDLVNYHGFIDLMMEYDDYINIIDYKLKHVDDKAYLKQLSGYKDYIENKTQKQVYLYLYSIIDRKILKLEV